MELDFSSLLRLPCVLKWVEMLFCMISYIVYRVADPIIFAKINFFYFNNLTLLAFLFISIVIIVAIALGDKLPIFDLIYTAMAGLFFFAVGCYTAVNQYNSAAQGFAACTFLTSFVYLAELVLKVMSMLKSGSN